VNIIKQLLMGISVFSLMLQPAFAETILIGGSTTVQKYIKLASKAYSSKHPEVLFSIYGGGSTAGVAQIIDKRINIGMMSRELTAQERQSVKSFQPILIALDAVIPIVSQEVYESGVQQVSSEALAKIYREEITNWKQVGGFHRQIITIDKNIYHGTRYVFSDYILGVGNALQSSASIVLNSDDDVMRLLKSSDQAIGYAGIGYLNKSVRALNIDVEGKVIKASYANIRNGTYPLSRKLYLLVPKDTPDYVRNFINFVLSPTGQIIVKEAGYLPVR